MMRAAAVMSLGLVLTQACAQERPMQLICELAIAKVLAPADKAELTFTLSNVGGQPLQVLVWQTPLEGVRNPMLSIQRDAAEVEYRGIMVKRSAPRADSYVLLKPGERRAAKIDLLTGWDVSAPGNYTVEYAGELLDVIVGDGPAPRPSGEMQATALNCPAVTFKRGQ